MGKTARDKKSYLTLVPRIDLDRELFLESRLYSTKLRSTRRDVLTCYIAYLKELRVPSQTLFLRTFPLFAITFLLKMFEYCKLIFIFASVALWQIVTNIKE